MSDKPADHLSPTRPTLVVVAGAMGAVSQLQPMFRVLHPVAETVGFNLQGHGRRRVPERMTLETMADDLAESLLAAGIRRPYLLGYCMGSLVVLSLISRRLDYAAGAVLVAPRYHHDEYTMVLWNYILSDERLKRRPDICEEHLANHGPDWRRLILAMRDVIEPFGQEDPVPAARLAQISCPVLIYAPDGDAFTTLEEGLWLKAAIPGAALVPVKGSVHPSSNIATPGFASEIADFFDLPIAGPGS